MKFNKKTGLVALASIFLLAGGSAAVLNYFATSQGTAEVTQAVVFDGQTGEASLKVFDTNNIVAGDTTVDRYSVTNNLGETYDLTYGSDLKNTSSGSYVAQDVSGTFIDWDDQTMDSVGINTTYAKYFTDAGHDFSSYNSVSASNADYVVDDSGGEDYKKISGAIAAADETDSDTETILVKDGSYINWIKVNKSVKLVSETPRGAEAGRFTVRSNDVTIKGFNITGDGANYNGVSIEPDNGAEDNVTIEDNNFQDITDRDRNAGKYEAYGVLAWEYDSSGNRMSDIVIKNNRFKNIGSDANNSHGYGVFVEDLPSSGTPLTVIGNTFEDINTAQISGDTYQGVAVAVLPELTDPTASTSDTGIITNNANSQVMANNFTSNPVDVSIAGDASQFSSSKNLFDNGKDFITQGNEPNVGGIGHMNLDSGNTQSVISNSPADATENYFGSDGITTLGNVDASWKELSTIPTGSSDLAVVNTFDLHMSGAHDYKFTTTIK